MAESEEQKSLVMKVKEENEKVGLKLNIQNTKIMKSGPIISWQIDGETTETDRLFSWAPKLLQMVTAAMKLKDAYFLGRKVMILLDSTLKSRDITLPTKVDLVKAMVFPVVMYEYKSWTIKKIDVFELWCWRRLLRVPWTARRSNQSILKEISPDYSSEGLMLKLKLQYFSQFSSVTQSCLTLCDPMNCSTPGLPVRHQLPEYIQTHVHRVSDAIQPSHPLSSPSPDPNPSQHQSLFQ